MKQNIQRIPFLSQIEDMEAYISQYKDMKQNNNSNNNSSVNSNYQSHNYSNNAVHNYNNNHYHNSHNGNNNNNNNSNNSSSNNNNNYMQPNHYQNLGNNYNNSSSNNNYHNNHHDKNTSQIANNNPSMQIYGNQTQFQRNGGNLNVTNYASLYLNNDSASTPNYLNVPAQFANGVYNGDISSGSASTAGSSKPLVSGTANSSNTSGFDQLISQRSTLVSPTLSTPDKCLSPRNMNGNMNGQIQNNYMTDFYNSKNLVGLGQSTLFSDSNIIDQNASSTNNNNNNAQLGSTFSSFTNDMSNTRTNGFNLGNQTSNMQQTPSNNSFMYAQTANNSNSNNNNQNHQMQPFQLGQFQAQQQAQPVQQAQQQSQFKSSEPLSDSINNVSMLSSYNKIWSDNMSVWS